MDSGGLWAPSGSDEWVGTVRPAQLGEHVSSSTLSAHQMARAGEPVDSDGSDVWVAGPSPPTSGKSYHWNRRTNSTTSVAPLGVKPERGNVWFWNQITGLTAHKLPPLPPG